MSNQAANGSTSGHSTRTSSTTQTSESKSESKSSPTTSKCSTSKHELKSQILPPKSSSSPPSSPTSSETSASSSPGPPLEPSLEALFSPNDIHDYALLIAKPFSTQHSSPPSLDTSITFSPSLPVSSGVPLDPSSTLQEAQDYELSSTLEMFLSDETHTVSTYGTSYINSLVYTYGFPDDQPAQEEIELEMGIEAESRARRLIEKFDQQMEAVGS
ncbi:hypothetical protein BDZ45DRAFT_242068 [Acephala macrosclerotiorum]|nr:hypothetical protein BDZ45DRAFT_242068 [Acephala macrosclerotiorum]